MSALIKPTTTDSNADAIGDHLRRFAECFGVRLEDMKSGGSILAIDAPDIRRLKNIDTDKGGIMAPGVSVAIGYDWDRVENIAFDVEATLTEIPVVAHAFGHAGVPAVTYLSDKGASPIYTKEYLERAANFYGIDPLADLDSFRIHPEEDHPLLVKDPEGVTEILLAPRRRRGEQ